MAQETNETKAKEIQFKDPCQVWIGGCPNVYAAPTLQMALKWLREIHGLHISILVKKHYGQICYFTVVENITTNREIYPNTNIAKCEQAAEAAIKYCLTNLID